MWETRSRTVRLHETLQAEEVQGGEPRSYRVQCPSVYPTNGREGVM